MTPWESLAAAYPWPSSCPDLLENIHGWQTHERHFQRLLEGIPDPVMLEVGAWTGKTSRLLMESMPDLRLVAVDTWAGCPELANHVDLVPILYPTYLRNLWNHRSRVIPVRETSVRGQEVVAERGLLPSLVYIDAGHGHEDAKADIETALALFPQSILCGDDYCIFRKGRHAGEANGVKRVIDKLADEGLRVRVQGRFWEALA